MEPYFDKLLEQYDKVYNEAVHGKRCWRKKAYTTSLVLLIIAFLMVALSLIPLAFTKNELIDSEYFILIWLGPPFVLWLIALLITVTLRNYDSTIANSVSVEFLNDWLEATSGCEIREVKNTYDVSFKEISSGANNKKIGRIKLLPQSAPPLLLSLRGKDGPVGRPTLTQDFRLIDDTNTDFTQRDSMPGITRSQFTALPDTATLPQLAVELFPDWVDDKVDTGHWIFTVADPGVQDELKEALDTLAVTILKLLIAESVEKAIEQNTPLNHGHNSGGFAYPRSELIRVLNSESTDSPYAEEARRLVDKVEAIATSDRPLIDADAPLRLKTATVA